MTHTEMPAILKVIIFLIIWVVLWLPIAIPVALWVKWKPGHPVTEQQKLPFVISLYLVVTLLFWGMTKWADLSWSNYGLTGQKQILISIAWGFGLGIVSLILLFGTQIQLGWLRWHSPEIATQSPIPLETGSGIFTLNWSHSVRQIGSSLLILGLALGIGGVEEFIFRGFVQTELQQDLTLVIAAILTSSLFAVSHLIWDIDKTLPQIPGLWLMGMVLTLACVCDQGSLGLAIGLHGGWIWGMTTIDPVNRMRSMAVVPAWVTGVGGQPLAGVAGIIFLLTTGTLLYQIYLN